jgi:hypothetical protein
VPTVGRSLHPSNFRGTACSVGRRELADIELHAQARTSPILSMRPPPPLAFAERTARIQRELSTIAHFFTLSPALLSLTFLATFVLHYLHHLLPS